MRFVSILFYILTYLLYYGYTNTHYPPTRFMAYLTPGAGISTGMFQKDLSQNRTRIQMNGEEKVC